MTNIQSELVQTLAQIRKQTVFNNVPDDKTRALRVGDIELGEKFVVNCITYKRVQAPDSNIYWYEEGSGKLKKDRPNVQLDPSVFNALDLGQFFTLMAEPTLLLRKFGPEAAFIYKEGVTRTVGRYDKCIFMYVPKRLFEVWLPLKTP